MNSEDGQAYYICILQFSCFSWFAEYNRMQLQHKQTKCEQTKLLQITAFSVGITIPNQRIG